MSTAASGAPGAPTIAYFTAVWLGMSPDDIARGIAEGRIAAPGAGLPPLVSDDGVTGEAAAPALGADAPVPVAPGSGPESAGVPAIAADASAVPEVGSGAPVPAPGRDDLEAILRALDPSLSTDAVARVWDHAGSSDDERANALLSHLARSLLAPAEAPSDDPAATLAALRQFLADPAPHAEVIDLTTRTGAELAALAASHAGYRAALLDLAPIALLGNAASHAGFGRDELARFDPDTGEQRRTDEWLADRAKLLAWKLAGPEALAAEDSGRWTFVDRSTALGGGGPPLRVETGEGAVGNTVAFGTDETDVLKGADGTDRLYGGAGDDLLRGNAGDDLLQGGDGDDVLLGGDGDDDLAGESGDDELEGGHGADRLRGGAGDDTLEGGAGDDRLEGGAGHDVYVIDSGDGTDTIADADGAGELQVNGQRLSGGSAMRDGRWWSEDGGASFAFSGDPAEGGTLVVARYAQAAPGDASSALPLQTIKVAHWRNGELGLVLGDGSAGAPGSSAAIASTSAAPVAAADMHADDAAIGVDASLDLRVMPGGSGGDGGVLEPAGDNAPPASVGAFFEGLPRAESIAGKLVDGQHLQAALDVWAHVADAPDIPPASIAPAPQVDAAPSVQGDSADLGAPGSASGHTGNAGATPPDVPMGVTAQDLAVALLDYHDDADLSVDPVMAVARPGTDWLHPMQHPSEPTAIRRIGSDQARV